MVGPWVTEQLGQAYLSVNWEATPSEVAHYIQPHPTCRRPSARPCSPSPEEVCTLPDITMPQLGETVTEGTITRWLKQVGDSVAEDEVLFEVSTDKVDSEVPSPVAGVLTEILVPEGDTVDVGTRLAVISDGADGAAAGPDRRPQPSPRPQPEPEPRGRSPSPRPKPSRRPEPEVEAEPEPGAASEAEPAPRAGRGGRPRRRRGGRGPGRHRRRRPAAGCSRRWCAG